MDDDESAEYGLVMPFVNVTSKGGLYDDEAFCAGYEMGLLDARLEYEQPAVHEQMVHEGNFDQADLIAMHRSYRCAEKDYDATGWRYIELVRIAS